MTTSAPLPPLRFDGRPVALEPRAPMPARLHDLAMRLPRAESDALEQPQRQRRVPPPQRLVLSPSERACLQAHLPMLTPRELDVLAALCEGGGNDQIARDLGIALPTLRSHLARTSQKLGAVGRIDLMRIGISILLHAHRFGLLADEHH